MSDKTWRFRGAQARGLSQSQFARIRHAVVAVRDHAVLRVRHRRHAAAPLNLTNLVLQNSYIVIMALGMLLVIVTGHIDLSVARSQASSARSPRC